MKDLSIFHDKKSIALESRVMSWLLDQTEEIVAKEEELDKMPDFLLENKLCGV